MFFVRRRTNMQPWLFRLGLIGLAASFNYLVWLWLGPVSFALCSPLYAYILARPILEFFSGSYRFTRELAFRTISGRYFEHRGVMIDIVEDVGGFRWLRTEDVRKFVVNLPDDRNLIRRHPEGVTTEGIPPKARIKAETLAVFLKTSTDPSAIKFKQWLERDVAFPARRNRERSRSNG